MAFEAYVKAESLGQKFNPDLHYNRAQLQLFSENWTAAYESLQLSSTLGKAFKLYFLFTFADFFNF